MKKILAVAALVLTVGVGSFVVNADSPRTPNVMPGEGNPNFTIEDRDAWRQERHSYRKEELKKALENKEITEAEAKEWEEHFDYMEEFHNKNRDNNYSFMGRGHGGCGGNGFGMGRGGHGMGMMRGNRR